MRPGLIALLATALLSGCGTLGTAYTAGEVTHEIVVRALTRAVIRECESIVAGGVAGYLRADVDAELASRGLGYRTSPPECNP